MKKIDLRSKSLWISLIFRVLLIMAGLILIRLYIGPLRLRILNLGNAFGLGTAGIMILVAVFFNPLLKWVNKLWKSKKGRALVSSVTAVVLAASIMFLGTLASIINNSHYSATDQTTVIVLGCRIWGSTPSRALIARTKAASEYLKKNPDAVAILSGGQGSDENLSEAQCMFNIMVEDGIDPQRLYIEDRSTSTDENILFSKKIIEENNLSTDVAVATTDYHQKRAAMICKKNGLTSASLPSVSGFNTKATFFTREVFGVWVQWLKLVL